MASDRFHGIDGKTQTELLTIESCISHTFKNPVLLLEALQFPRSIVGWHGSDDNTGLQVVGSNAISLARAAVEYNYTGLATSRGIYYSSYMTSQNH